ncbi:unnamed protein product [Sphagnum troendelagicum]|uniref:Uncharacterized protein n=1 Tax=Sphagnum troendelagicum TaxID=128251 RepID=A0ABP0TIH9_9BRYO
MTARWCCHLDAASLIDGPPIVKLPASKNCQTEACGHPMLVKKCNKTQTAQTTAVYKRGHSVYSEEMANAAIKLNSGHKMPMLGLGVCGGQIQGA